MVASPRVFISYSHDSPRHKVWVLKLASDLRNNGVDAVIDQWDLSPGEDIATFMEHGVRDSARVVVVCSSKYVERANAGKGGVGYEKMIVTAELIENLGTKKFIPIVRGAGPTPVPTFLGYRLYIDFEDDAKYPSSVEELLRELLDVPDPGKPPLGSNPFGPSGSGSVVVETSPPPNPGTHSKPGAEQPNELEDAARATVKKLKELIAQQSHPMLLDDLVMACANEARSKIEAAGILEFSTSPLQEELVRRVRAADGATNKLAFMFAVGCYWANVEQSEVFTKALRRIAITPEPVGTFFPAWENVARYAALRVMYAGGVAASAKNAFDVLAQLLVRSKMRPTRHEPEVPLVVAVHYKAAFMRDHWKWLPGRERHFVPVSDYLEDSLRLAWHEVVNDDDQISIDFDTFEFFQALIYADLAEPSTAFGFWAPLGSFIWRRQNLFAQVRGEIQKSGESWKPLRAGLFSGSPDRAGELVDKLEEFAGRVRGQLGVWS